MLHRRVPRILLVLVIALATAASLDAGAKAARALDSYVTRSGTQLLLDGVPYRFSGFNVYNANSSGLCWYAMDSGAALDDALSGMDPPYNDVMRSWFFQALATHGGVRDWSAFDHTLAAAQQRGVRVIATLGNQWGDCEPSAGYRDDDWYQSGYTAVDPSGIVSYRDWVAEVVTRYRDHPSILMWQLMNEAEVRPSNSACPPNDGPADILKAWAADVSALVKSIDGNHLVSLGTMGGGQCGAQGAQYQYVHDLPTIDLCEYHDYGSLAPMPGDQWNGLQVRIDQCTALNKPIFVGEAGVRPSDVDGTLVGRAAVLDAKLDAQFSAGVSGVVVWAWSNLGSTLDNFDIGPGDPLIDVLALAPEADTDGDGCTDEIEDGTNPVTGGDRDNLDGWDLYDVNANYVVDLSDTLVVLQHFGHNYNGGAYADLLDNLLDRAAPSSLKPWRTTESNSGIDLVDALANLKSFGHHCS